MAINKSLIGVLLLVILTSSVYILLDEKVRIDVQKTKTLISVYEDGKWVLGATEFLNLFDGTKKMRASSREVVSRVEGDIIIITRTSLWKDNIKTVHEYTFDSTISDVELTPLKETLHCYNCEGKIVHFEYRNILYTGITRDAISPETFGHNIKVEWEDGYDWAKAYQQRVASDKLVIRYRPQEDYESYDVRIFDPPSQSVIPIKKCYFVTEEVFEKVNVNVNKKRTVTTYSTYYYNTTVCDDPPFNQSCRNVLLDAYPVKERHQEDYVGQEEIEIKVNKTIRECVNIGFDIGNKRLEFKDWDCKRKGFFITCDAPHQSNKDGIYQSGERYVIFDIRDNSRQDFGVSKTIAIRGIKIE